MGGEFGGRMDTCICMAESLHCSVEIITTLLISYIPIYKKKYQQNYEPLAIIIVSDTNYYEWVGNELKLKYIFIIEHLPNSDFYNANELKNNFTPKYKHLNVALWTQGWMICVWKKQKCIWM